MRTSSIRSAAHERTSLRSSPSSSGSGTLDINRFWIARRVRLVCAERPKAIPILRFNHGADNLALSLVVEIDVVEIVEVVALAVGIVL